MAPAALDLFGGFQLRVGRAAIECASSAQRLLAFLALHPRPQSRVRVAGLLWPETSDRRAAANLRSSLWRLPDPPGVSLVECLGPSIALAPQVEVDVRRAEQVGWECVHDTASIVDPGDASLFFDELLPGWYDDWVTTERERLGQLRLSFLEAIAYALLRQGAVVDALDVALRLVAGDPLREQSQRALISVYRATGSLGQSVRQLEAYRALLREAIGCEPPDALVEYASSPATVSP
jgi:DNA-binding SARP family transcriptional activator